VLKWSPFSALSSTTDPILSLAVGFQRRGLLLCDEFGKISFSSLPERELRYGSALSKSDSSTDDLGVEEIDKFDGTLVPSFKSTHSMENIHLELSSLKPDLEESLNQEPRNSIELCQFGIKNLV
jgi:hypothetical protein